MKKYILSLAILAFIFSLLTVSAGSARAYECEPGHLFSIFTGQPCPAVSSSNTNFSDLKIGSRGERVRAFQQMLKDGGFLYGKVDGVYGRITDGAAKNYYKIYPPTPINTNAPTISGVSGPQTLNVNQEGTWTVTAYDVVGGGNLSYTVVWGDEVYYSGSVSASQRPAQQSATFTHSYSVAGTYNPTFTVTNKYGQSAKTSLSVVVGNVNPPTPTDSITVISPNGGENWLIGNTESIRWSDSTPTLFCLNCGNTYDITLQPVSCPVGMACAAVYHPSYTVAKGVRGSVYSWVVGQAWADISDYAFLNGLYKVQVCQSGTSNCDLSDSYFTISRKIVTQEAPVISSISPSSGVSGTQVTITGTGFTSTGNKIKFSSGIAGNDSGYYSSNGGTTITFTVPFYSSVTGATIQPGAYDVSVMNANGTSNTVTFTVVANSPVITVLSPNGGEVWTRGTTQTIRWSDNRVFCDSLACMPKYDIMLFSYPTGEMFTVARDVTGSSYNWLVGTTDSTVNGLVPDSYSNSLRIQVCQSNTVCDFSDNYFRIVNETNNQITTISSLSPISGPVGTTVTITGTGFSATGNKIRFGNLGVENSPSYNNLSSGDGTHLTFTVPYSNYMACWDSHPACMVAAYTTAPGTYAVSVINSSGKASNELSFTVTQ